MEEMADFSAKEKFDPEYGIFYIQSTLGELMAIDRTNATGRE
jgi:hypothetical protein